MEASVSLVVRTQAEVLYQSVIRWAQGSTHWNVWARVGSQADATRLLGCLPLPEQLRV